MHPQRDRGRRRPLTRRERHQLAELERRALAVARGLAELGDAGALIARRLDQSVNPLDHFIAAALRQLLEQQAAGPSA